MAAVEIRPMLDFTYVRDNKIEATSFAAKTLPNGRTLEGRLLSVPPTFDSNSIEACARDNTGDFVVGMAVNLSGHFAQKYLQKFYNTLSATDLVKLAEKGILYGEVFFPAESGSSKVMVCKVIAEADGNAMLDRAKDLTYYQCFIPTPVLVLDAYKDSFQVAGPDGAAIETPSYQSSANYSYLKGMIGGFSPAVVKQYLAQQGQIFSNTGVSITRWPGVAANGSTAFGRFRFCIPEQKVSQARDAMGKDVPEALVGITDKAIADGITATPVAGTTAASSWTGNPGDKDLTIMGIECMNVPESGGSLDQYKDLDDGAGITFSWCSLTQGEDCRGSLYYCIMEDYAAINPTDPELNDLKREVLIKGSARLAALLQARAHNRKMIQATIRTYKKMYYSAAMKNIERVGVTTPLGIVSVIRMTTHYPNNIYKAQQDNEIAGEWGKNIEPHGRGAEADRQWLRAYWESYRKAGEPGHKSHGGRGWGGWRNEADVWLKQLEGEGNMDCKNPIDWRSNWSRVATLGKPTLPIVTEYADLFVKEQVWT